MARTPPLTGLRTEDYPPEQRQWLGRLFTAMNPFLLGVTNAVNGAIEFGPNIPCQDQVLSFTYDGSTLPRFAWTQIKPPAVMMVGQATENQQPIAVSVAWLYDPSTRTVSVREVLVHSATGTSGLTTGKAYRIFVRVIP